MRELPCSDVEVEPLPGTAKPGSVYVLFEWPEAWPRDVMGDAALGGELTDQLAPMLDEHDATLLLIRHPTREGRNISDHHLYLVFADEGVTEVMHVDGPEALLDLDLSGPGRNGAVKRDRPLLLICTHAKRDKCCAVKGRPLVNALHERHPFGPGNDIVWETSHIKGHRFAPTMLLMPWAYSFGRMNVEATEAMLAAAGDGLYFVPGNRGRGTLAPIEQVAELAVAVEVPGAHYGQFAVAAGAGESVAVTDTASGEVFDVQLEQRTVFGVVDSCGKAPKEGAAWVAVSVTSAGPGA
ncbi:sucrase ferredoxin [Corynebacterium sp. zg912]|uniref:Sucrase ferredoxin n=1 Tax=Corynebacterium wankanglinii TaxID=2735136 RepID=A0A7H0KB22_9CORY|nr:MULTISPECIES: sucrase ferredoxin [Corynebacterium]MBA1836812.1 sucrase ferredoxin [Corynebacterium wankanglinii]MCR5929847.1 sucrase ferredoxin [Corynebacterium sp. zg912]QNP94488.1 sucrase ferredoxin [Corynebacterium wankanglinii]